MFRRKDCVWLVALVVLVAAFSGSAFAAKGGGRPAGGGTSVSSISQPVMVTDVGSPGLSAGDTVTFNVSSTATTTPWVNVQCSQNGAVVYNGWKAFWVGSLDPTWNFILNSAAWQSGAADCVATVDNNTKQGMKQLASTSFHVDA